MIVIGALILIFGAFLGIIILIRPE